MGHNYGAVDSLTLTGSGNPLESFRCVSCEPVYRNQGNEKVDTELGEFDPDTHHVFNEIIGYEAEYECKVRTLIEDLTLPAGDDDAMQITQAVLTQVNNKHARIRVTAHEHPISPDNFGEHLDNARDLVFPAFLGFGANDLLDVFASELDVQSCTYTITLGHQDDSNNTGGHLVGRSQGEMHSCTVEAITDELPADPDAPWKRTEKSQPRTRDGQYRAKISAEKLIAGPA